MKNSDFVQQWLQKLARLWQQLLIHGKPLWARFLLALTTFWRIITDAGYARQLEKAGAPAERDLAPATTTAPPPILHQTQPDSALQMLGLLQQEGRLVDFLQEDIRQASDDQIGAAVRTVHAGCRKVLQDYFVLEPIRQEEEGLRLTLEDNFDVASIRLVGNVVGQAPFNGTLVHRGWRVSDSHLPKVTEGHDVAIIAPAEVEL